MPNPGALLVPIMFSVAQRSWPRWGDLAKPVPYLPLSVALTRRFPHDAHTAAYSRPHFPRRLSRDALSPESKSRLPGGVFMVLAIFDADCPASHRASGHSDNSPVLDEWWHAERVKLEALRRAHPNLFAYRTRGGYRILAHLLEPCILREPADAAAWSLQYMAWCAYLARRFEIQVDLSCKDWQRLYRLPHATRSEGGKPEEREILGNPRQIGLWHCQPAAEDLVAAQTRCKKNPGTQKLHRPHGGLQTSSGEGVLYHAFRARGWLGREIEPGKWSVQCPWEDSHTKGLCCDTSTIIFAPGDGEATGWFHCSHNHCQGRDLRDALAVFSSAELDRARQAAGVSTVSVTSGRWPSRMIVEVA